MNNSMNPYLSGNYAPVQDELHVKGLDVTLGEWKPYKNQHAIEVCGNPGNHVIPNAVRDLQIQAQSHFQETPHVVRDDFSRGY